MPYSTATVERVERLPRGLQRTLARATIKLDLPISQLAQAVGATRWTVYRWFKGYEVSPAYRQRVTEITLILENSATKEQAWKTLTARFVPRA